MKGTDIFAIPYKDRFIVYAPLHGKLFYANAACVAQLQTYRKCGDPEAIAPEVQRQMGGLEWLLNEPDAPVPIGCDTPYQPVATTLFLTNACNLRCRYCYARSGNYHPATMPLDMARAAVDLVLRNAREKELPAYIGFHGGGEPSCAWEVVQGVIAYGQEQCGESGQLAFGMATNGVMRRDQAEYLARHMKQVTLSFDGPPEIQNTQRPKVDGSGSYEDVLAFVAVLQEQKTPFVIRCTVTDLNVEQMPELVDFFADMAPGTLIHFEPAFGRGRCLDNPEQIPLADHFAERFIEALERAEAREVMLRYSAARIRGAYSSFCGCAQDAFNVTHDGHVTGCYEVCDGDSDLADIFHYGKWNPDSKTFDIDRERLNRLRQLTVQNKELCTNCFAKWNCSGDCPVKLVHGEARFDFQRPSARCSMNQKITRHLLTMALDSKKCRFV